MSLLLHLIKTVSCVKWLLDKNQKVTEPDGVEFDVTEAKIVVTRDEVAAVTGSRTESD